MSVNVQLKHLIALGMCLFRSHNKEKRTLPLRNATEMAVILKDLLIRIRIPIPKQKPLSKKGSRIRANKKARRSTPCSWSRSLKGLIMTRWDRIRERDALIVFWLDPEAGALFAFHVQCSCSLYHWGVWTFVQRHHYFLHFFLASDYQKHLPLTWMLFLFSSFPFLLDNMSICLFVVIFMHYINA